MGNDAKRWNGLEAQCKGKQTLCPEKVFLVAIRSEFSIKEKSSELSSELSIDGARWSWAGWSLMERDESHLWLSQSFSVFWSRATPFPLLSSSSLVSGHEQGGVAFACGSGYTGTREPVAVTYDTTLAKDKLRCLYFVAPSTFSFNPHPVHGCGLRVCLYADKEKNEGPPRALIGHDISFFLRLLRLDWGERVPFGP